MKGMIVGVVLGAAAIGAYSMLNERTKRKMLKAAACAGNKMAYKAGAIFGK